MSDLTHQSVVKYFQRAPRGNVDVLDGTRTAAQGVAYIDSHVHIQLTAQRLQQEVARGSPVGPVVDGLLACLDVYAPCCSLVNVNHVQSLFQSGLTLQRSRPHVYGTYGIHPHHASDWSEAVALQLRECLADPRSVAVGETGLDYYRLNSPKDVQVAAFRAQIGLAEELDKPLVVHTRDAEADTAAMLREFASPARHMHIHCFTGTCSFIEGILQHFPNAYVGFTGAITFRNAESLREVVKSVPLSRMLLETDAPYMAPDPFRGSIASPMHIPFTARTVARLHGVPLADVLATTTANAQRMYSLDVPPAPATS